jgi:hypothetical protein
MIEHDLVPLHKLEQLSFTTAAVTPEEVVERYRGQVSEEQAMPPRWQRWWRRASSACFRRRPGQCHHSHPEHGALTYVDIVLANET